VNTELAQTMSALEAVAPAGRPASEPLGLKVGLDLGTAYTVLVVLDEQGAPLALAHERADVVRDGVVTDFVGAVDVVGRLKQAVESRLGVPLEAAHGAYPPGVPTSEVRAVRHVIEAVGMECTGLVDEPTAANTVLGLRDGVVVDVGGGTTGIAVVEDGEVVHTADEATGGTHFSLVVAGALGISVEEAEALKTRSTEQERLFPVVRPVMEKVATIIARHTATRRVSTISLVGGTVAFPRFAEVVTQMTGIPAVVPVSPLFVTPLGIARTAPARYRSYRPVDLEEMSR
jgi:ethanolamine utilization protein EutJ